MNWRTSWPIELSRESKSIVELGVICGVCVIILDLLLAHFEVLMWPALGVTFLAFALLILDSLSHLTTTPKRAIRHDSRPRDDELARLQAIIERNVSKHETQTALVERLRAIGLSVASARMNLSKEQLCDLIATDPEPISARLNDRILFSFLSGEKTTLVDVQEIHDLLSRIERL